MARLLTIKDLTLEAHNNGNYTPIINNIDLRLDRGEVLGIIGESGAGKTTIGLAALGYFRPESKVISGSIVFDGTDLIMASEVIKRRFRGTRMAYVAQNASTALNPMHRLLDQCVESQVQHRMITLANAKQKLIEIFKNFNLPEPNEIGYRYPHQVSGGQLQRVMIAMALAGNPELIVFDEPTTALDLMNQNKLIRIIKAVIRERQSSALYISHNLAVVEQLADRIMVLKNGKFVEEGITGTLISYPQQEYTRQLIFTTPSQRQKTFLNEEEVILDICKVSAGYYRNINVLDNITFKVHRGKNVAVVGESGSGKTTLARVITGLLQPLEGSIYFNGRLLQPLIKSRDIGNLRRLQLIHQSPDNALNPRHNIRKTLGRPLSFYFGLYGEARESRIKDLLEMVELSDISLGRYPSELSGGEKQRLCIARALAANPEMIICDEITSSLDRLVAKSILILLKNLQIKLQCSYLFITHDLTIVKAIADEIIVLKQGNIIEQGEVEKIFASPHHEYTKLLLNNTNRKYSAGGKASRP